MSLDPAASRPAPCLLSSGGEVVVPVKVGAAHTWGALWGIAVFLSYCGLLAERYRVEEP